MRPNRPSDHDERGDEFGAGRRPSEFDRPLFDPDEAGSQEGAGAFDDLEDEEGDAAEIEDEAISEVIEGEPRTVMITGACGNIGRKLRAAWTDVYDLVLIDEVAGEDDPEVIEADLAVLDDDWITHFHGVDTVVHLAANSDELAPWDELIGPNL